MLVRVVIVAHGAPEMLPALRCRGADAFYRLPLPSPYGPLAL
jgi:hypothetical protein